MTRPRPFVLGVVVVVIAVVLAGLMVFRALNQPERTTADTSSAPGTSSVPAPSASPTRPSASPQATTTTSPPAEKCPTPDYKGDRASIDNRVYDFVEAAMIPNEKRRREALETAGFPARIVTEDFFEHDFPIAVPPDDNFGLRYVLDRGLTQLEFDEFDANTKQVIVSGPVWTSCRGEKKENGPTAQPDVIFALNLLKQGDAWYITWQPAI